MNPNDFPRSHVETQNFASLHERATQDRAIALLRDELKYSYLGDWRDRDDNSNIEEHLLTAYLSRNGYSTAQINKAIHALRAEADSHSRGLYGNNKAVYNLLRYGAPVKIEAGKITEQLSGALWIIFFASWVIIGLIGWLYFRFNTNIDLKRRFHKWSMIVYGTMFFLLIALTFVGRLSPILLFFGAAIALIVYLNIRWRR